jgi:hypothetical protein
MSKKALTPRPQPNQVNGEYSCGDAALLNGGIIRARQWQRMTANTGISHSEFDASKTEPVHFSSQGFRRVKSGNS